MDPTPSLAAPGLGRAAVSGVMWQGVSYIGGKLLTLVTTIVLARLLTPQDFGLVTLALVFIMYAEVVADLGVSNALIYFPEDDRQTDSAVTIAVLWSAGLIALGFAAAPAIAGFFDRPDVVPLFRVLCVSLLVSSIGSVPDALLRKRLLFRRRLVIILARLATKAAVSIAFALAGAGAWAIAAGYVAGEVAWAIGGWIMLGRAPRLARIRGELARPLLRYGLAAGGNALLLSLVFNIDYLIIGERLGTGPLGYYSIAYRVPEVLILQALWVVSAVAFPLFSHVRGDRDRLHRGYVTGLRLQTTYGVAAGVGIATVAPMLIPVVFGERWIPAIGALQGIAFYAVFGSLAKSAMDLYKGVGRPGLAVTMSLLRLGLVLPTLILAARFGIDGVAWGHAAAAFVSAVVLQAVAIRLIGLPVGRVAAAVVPALAAGVGVALGAGAVRLWLPGSNGVRLLAAIVAGASLGALTTWRADPSFVREVRGLLRRRERVAVEPDAPA